MSSNKLRVLSTQRLTSRLSPVVGHKPNFEACLTPLTSLRSSRRFPRKQLQFPSPVVAVSSPRLSPRSPHIAILVNNETVSTSTDITRTYVIPSVNKPDRDHFPVTRLGTSRRFPREQLQFPSSPRLSPRSHHIPTLVNNETVSTSTDIPRSYVIPSVSTPDRDHFLNHGLDNRKQWNVLGRGTFGMVIEAKYRGKNVAVKIVSKTKFLESIATVENEKNAIGLAHPNIINVLNVINDNKDIGLIIMDKHVGMDLQQILDDNYFTLSTPQRLGYAIDISHGIEFCHSKRILHLDIKPKNIIVCYVTKTCKLCDFGSSTKIFAGKKADSYKHVNTVAYAAPEILKGKPPTCASDIYSFGVTMWQLQSREIPYNEDNMQSIIYRVCNSRARPSSTEDRDKYTQLYKKCWHQEPNYRPHLAYVIDKLYKLKSTK